MQNKYMVYRPGKIDAQTFATLRGAKSMALTFLSEGEPVAKILRYNPKTDGYKTVQEWSRS